MLQQAVVIVLAFVGNFIIQWYANFSGHLPSKGTYLGISYDSIFVRALVTQFEYLWVLVLINVFFMLGFSIGFATFKNFLTLMLIWLAMGPISAFVFSTLVLKEKISFVSIIGVVLIIAGSVCVVAQKEIAALFKS